MTKLKQTGIKVNIIGKDGNANYILGKVSQALCRGGYSKEFIDAFLVEAKRSDYNHLLYTVGQVVKIR